jgi:hypothetical protein
MFESKHESLSILWMNTKHKMYTEVDNNKIFIGIWNVQIDTEHFKNVLRVEEEIIAELV